MLLIVRPRRSQELRERVRDQIVHALKAFDDESVVGDNQVVAHLLERITDERATRQRNLRMQWPVSTRQRSQLRISSVSSC